MTSRRGFLQLAAGAGALGLLTRLPGRQLWALTPLELLPEPDEALLRELALAAMEAARRAGATFADVRLAAGRDIGMTCSYVVRGDGPPTVLSPNLSRTNGYGIRAIVDGAWGFAAGTELTLDAVVEAARSAVALARSNRSRRGHVIELASAARVENSVWTTPMERDPLTVPLEEMRDLGFAALTGMPKQGILHAYASFGWRRPTTVFASTDGTLILQRLCQGGAGGSVFAGEDDTVWENVKALGGGYGYEAVQPATFATRLRDAAERVVAVERAARAARSVEVGRYDLVFGAEAVAKLLAATVAEATNLERALGYQANSAGTSFAAPPADILGKYQVGSELLTVRADRTQPHGWATVGWDEEGVKPEEYTFIRKGVIVDYHTNRQTAMELSDWYRSQGKPVRSHGCSRRTGRRRPEILIPNLTLEPGAGTTTVDDLIAGTRRGFYVEEAWGLSPDHQVLNTQGLAWHFRVRRVTNGVLGGYVRDFAYQFVTPQFWKSVDGIGGAGTAETIQVDDEVAMKDRLQPFPASTVRVVPMRVRQVNVLNTGRTA